MESQNSMPENPPANIEVPQSIPVPPVELKPNGKKVWKIIGIIVSVVVVIFILLAWWGFNLEKNRNSNCQNIIETNDQAVFAKLYECFYNSVKNSDYNVYMAISDPETPGYSKGMSPEEWSQAVVLLKAAIPDPKAVAFVVIKQVGGYSLYFISSDVGSVNKGKAVYFIPFRKIENEWKIYGGVNYLPMFDLKDLSEVQVQEKINQKVEEGVKSFSDSIN